MASKSSNDGVNLANVLKKLTRGKFTFPADGKHEENHIYCNDFPYIQSDFLFPPISINSLPCSLKFIPSVQEYKKRINDVKFGPFDIKCPISRMIIDYDLKILEMSPTLIPNEPVIKKDLKCLKNLKRDRTILRELCCNVNTTNKKKKDKEEYYSLFNGTKDSPRISLSVKFHEKEDFQISILRGFDERLGPNSNIMPPTAMHKCSKDDIRQYLKTINIKPFKEDLKDHKISFDYIIYYMTNGLWKSGYVYWIIEEDDMIYMYDLTSSFQMVPYVIEEDESLNKDERAAKNAIGLLYYHTARQCYLDNREKHYHIINEMCLRAIALIDENVNPLEFCMAYIIRDKTNIPDNMEFENPSLLCVSESGKVHYKKTKKQSFDSITASDLSLKLKTEITSLTDCLEFLVKRLTDIDRLPYLEGNWDDIVFNENLNDLVKELLPAKIMHVEVSSLKESIMDSYMTKYTDDWEFRMVVYFLRKMYHELVVSGRLDQKLKRYASVVIVVKESLKVWHAMASLISPYKQVPLPLMPLVMLGEVFHLYSADINTAKKECKKYNLEDVPEWSNKTLPSIAATLEDQRCILTYPDSKMYCQLPFLKLSLEIFVRTLLCTEVEPTKELLQHVCHVMNEISYIYLLRCDEKDASFQSHSDAKEILKNTEDIITVTKIFAKSIDDSKNLLLAFCNNGRYTRYNYFYNEFLKNGKHLLTKVLESYKKAFSEYEAALNFVGENSTYCKDLIGIIVWEYTEALDEFCSIHRMAENIDRSFHHKEILRKYERILIISLQYKKHYACLEYSLAKGSALVAEYLYGLYIDTQEEVLRTSVIMWYNEAIARFNQMSNQKTPIEHLKLLLELAKYYENAALDVEGSHLTYQECFKAQYKILIMCENPLKQLKSISVCNPWAGQTSETKNARNILIVEYPKQAISNLQEALRKWIKHPSENIKVDFPVKLAKEIYKLTLYDGEVCLIDHLIKVLPSINNLSRNFLGDED